MTDKTQMPEEIYLGDDEELGLFVLRRSENSRHIKYIRADKVLKNERGEPLSVDIQDLQLENLFPDGAFATQERETWSDCLDHLKQKYANKPIIIKGD